MGAAVKSLSRGVFFFLHSTARESQGLPQEAQSKFIFMLYMYIYAHVYACMRLYVLPHTYIGPSSTPGGWRYALRAPGHRWLSGGGSQGIWTSVAYRWRANLSPQMHFLGVLWIPRPSSASKNISTGTSTGTCLDWAYPSLDRAYPSLIQA